MKNKIIILLAVTSFLLGPISLIPDSPNPAVIQLFNHGEG